MKAWLAALVVAAAACATAATRTPTFGGPVQPPPLPDSVRLGIRQELLDALAWIQRDVRTEGLLCLGGQTENGRLVIGSVTPTRISEQSDSTVYAPDGGCRLAPGVYGAWHPHVWRWANDCRFSDTDRANFEASGLLFDLLGCANGDFRIRIRGDTTTYGVR